MFLLSQYMLMYTFSQCMLIYLLNLICLCLILSNTVSSAVREIGIEAKILISLSWIIHTLLMMSKYFPRRLVSHHKYHFYSCLVDFKHSFFNFSYWNYMLFILKYYILVKGFNGSVNDFVFFQLFFIY